MAARKRAGKSHVAELLDDLISMRDRMLRDVGREESVEERRKLLDRMRDTLAESTEGMIYEALERAVRIELGLPVAYLDPDSDDGDVPE
jgi:hypothetical protein